jgi:uridine kinase
MIETGDYSFLKVKLKEKLNKRFIHIIGVDGCLDVGKSELSKNLSRDVGGIHIELDHYLKDDETLSYTDRLYNGILKKTIEYHLDEWRIVIVDGVCLLWVLRKVQYKPDIHVYIKRTTPIGSYRDEDYFDETISEEQMMVEVEENQMNYSRIEANTELDRAIIRYHKRAKPYSQADFVFRRGEEDRRTS